VFIARKRRVFTRPEARRRIEPLLEALVSEAAALDYSPDDLRTALEQKLARWNFTNRKEETP
jgi:hypothetical protein